MEKGDGECTAPFWRWRGDGGFRKFTHEWAGESEAGSGGCGCGRCGHGCDGSASRCCRCVGVGATNGDDTIYFIMQATSEIKRVVSKDKDIQGLMSVGYYVTF